MRPLDIAWTLLKALPEQREMADSGQVTPSPYMGPEQYEDVDMGTIHTGALSAMRRLQKPSSYVGRTYDDTGQVMDPGRVDTRSYDPSAEYYRLPPGLLMGTQHDRAISRTGRPAPDMRFYNPDTGQMEDIDGYNE